MPALRFATTALTNLTNLPKRLNRGREQHAQSSTSSQSPPSPTPQPTAASNSSANIGYSAKLPIIEATGLSKVYHIGKQLVSPVGDISFQISYGDFVVIFGPSGAGKSTLLNILMGIEKPDLGQVLLKGESLYDYSEEERATIRLKKFGLIPQDQLWLEHMSLLDNVSLPLLLQGQSAKQAHQQAAQLLKDFHLTDRQRHKMHELSSGQQQKASILRAMVNQPWIIFADEPTAHLDSTSTADIINTLTQANQQGLTIVMVTHDLEFLKYAKKWFFVKDGRLWDIKDRHNPFTDIQQAVQYIDQTEEPAR